MIIEPLPQVASQIVFENEPAVVDLTTRLVLPSHVTLSYQNTSLVGDGDRSRKLLEATVDFDYRQRPIKEQVVKGDGDEITVREWHYQGAEGDFVTTETVDDGEEQQTEARVQVAEDQYLFTKNGHTFALKKRQIDGQSAWVLTNEKGGVVEVSANDEEGKLKTITEVAGKKTPVITELSYDAKGRLVLQEKNPGSVKVGETSYPDIRTYAYLDGRVVVFGERCHRGTSGSGVPDLSEKRHYDAEGRLASITSETGAYEISRHLIEAEIQYPE